MNRAKYQSVVDEAKQRWKTLIIPKPEMKWCSDCDEINLWTYWQGRGVQKVDILVVGQDWGRPESNGNSVMNSKTNQIIANVRKMNACKTKTHYFDNINSYPDPTDKHLAELFAELCSGDKQLYPRILKERYDNLFFTNFCLGYRTGKQTGDMTRRVMMKDSDLFKQLVEALEPKIVICLGLLTYQCVIETLFGGILRYKNKDFLKYLNLDGAVKEGCVGGNPLIVYGMVHCGATGVNINRKGDCADTLSGLDLMKKDWRRVNSDITRLKIKVCPL